MNSVQRIYQYLASNPNRSLTVAAARRRFGIKNVSARISDIRKAGVPVTLVKNSRNVTAYRLAY